MSHCTTYHHEPEVNILSYLYGGVW